MKNKVIRIMATSLLLSNLCSSSIYAADTVTGDTYTDETPVTSTDNTPSENQAQATPATTPPEEVATVDPAPMMSLMADPTAPIVYESEVHVTKASDFDQMRDNPAATYILENDIDFEGGSWVPAPNFTGNIEGGGFTIKNVNASSAWVTIFGGKLENVNFSNVKVTSSNTGAIFSTIRQGVVYNVMLDNVHLDYNGASSSAIGVLAGVVERASNVVGNSAKDSGIRSSTYDGTGGAGFIGSTQAGGFLYPSVVNNSVGTITIDVGNTAKRVGGLVGDAQIGSFTNNKVELLLQGNPSTLQEVGGAFGRSGSSAYGTESRLEYNLPTGGVAHYVGGTVGLFTVNDGLNYGKGTLVLTGDASTVVDHIGSAIGGIGTIVSGEPSILGGTYNLQLAGVGTVSYAGLLGEGFGTASSALVTTTISGNDVSNAGGVFGAFTPNTNGRFTIQGSTITVDIEAKQASSSGNLGTFIGRFTQVAGNSFYLANNFTSTIKVKGTQGSTLQGLQVFGSARAVSNNNGTATMDVQGVSPKGAYISEKGEQFLGNNIKVALNVDTDQVNDLYGIKEYETVYNNEIEVNAVIKATQGVSNVSTLFENNKSGTAPVMDIANSPLTVNTDITAPTVTKVYGVGGTVTLRDTPAIVGLSINGTQVQDIANVYYKVANAFKNSDVTVTNNIKAKTLNNFSFFVEDWAATSFNNYLTLTGNVTATDGGNTANEFAEIANSFSQGSIVELAVDNQVDVVMPTEQHTVWFKKAVGGDSLEKVAYVGNTLHGDFEMFGTMTNPVSIWDAYGVYRQNVGNGVSNLPVTPNLTVSRFYLRPSLTSKVGYVSDVDKAAMNEETTDITGSDLAGVFNTNLWQIQDTSGVDSPRLVWAMERYTAQLTPQGTGTKDTVEVEWDVQPLSSYRVWEVGVSDSAVTVLSNKATRKVDGTKTATHDFKVGPYGAFGVPVQTATWSYALDALPEEPKPDPVGVPDSDPVVVPDPDPQPAVVPSPAPTPVEPVTKPKKDKGGSSAVVEPQKPKPVAPPVAVPAVGGVPEPTPVVTPTLRPCAVQVPDASKVRVYINCEEVQFPDAQPYIVAGDNRVVIPLRFIYENKDIQNTVRYITMQGQRQKVLLSENTDRALNFKVGVPSATSTQGEFPLEIAPFLRQSRVYLPLRAYMDLLHNEVDWDADQKAVFIFTTPEYNKGNMSYEDWFKLLADFNAKYDKPDPKPFEKR